MPNESVHLAITSPPYNVGLEYDSHNDKMPYAEYLKWLTGFWKELYRVLVNGGRFALNVAPTSIKDFRPIHYDMARDLMQLGFIMRTEIPLVQADDETSDRLGIMEKSSQPSHGAKLGIRACLL